MRILKYAKIFLFVIAASTVLAAVLTTHFSLASGADGGTEVVSGTVTDQSGNGVQNVSVTATDPGGTTVDYGPVITDQNGNYSLDVDAGTYDFHFAPASGAYSPSIDSGVTADSNQTIDIQLSPATYTFSGTITDQNGNPITDLSVGLSSTSGSGGGSAVTDSNGNFSVVVTSGTYYVIFQDSNGSPELLPGVNLQGHGIPVDLTSSNVTQDFAIPTAPLSVTVNDSSGNPEAGALVTMSDSGNSGSTVISSGSNNYTLSDGGNGNPEYNADGNGMVTENVPVGSVFPANNICVKFADGIRSCNTNPVTISNSTNIIFQEGIGVILTPSAPTNLTAPTPTDTSPSLSWDAVTGATSYNIYRDGVNIGSSTTNSYSDTSALTSGTTYAYCVTAVNSSGESSCSSTINVEYYTTDPTLTYTLTPVLDSNGYNTGNVLVTVNCSSAVGMHDQTPNPSTTVPDEGIGQTVSASCTDNAGNTTMENINPSLLVSAIAAGNNDGAVPYSSDTGYSGGSTYSSSAAVDTSQVLNPAPQSVYQNSRYGDTFTYTFSGLTPGSAYTLRLDFNELYFGTALSPTGGIGSRVFNVDVNGSPALANFDIYAAAGGSNKAIAEQIPTTADSNGNVTVTFSAVTDNALVNGLSLFTGTLPPLAPKPTVTSTYIAAGSSTAIGGFSSDNDYSGGTTYSTSANIDMTNAGTTPEAVYQTDRYGNFTYTIPNLVPNTTYNVQLDFAEPYFNSEGARTFNVTVNGDTFLNDFDIFKAAGDQEDKAVNKSGSFASDNNGRVTIDFDSINNNALVDGIEVTEQ